MENILKDFITFFDLMTKEKLGNDSTLKYIQGLHNNLINIPIYRLCHNFYKEIIKENAHYTCENNELIMDEGDLNVKCIQKLYKTFTNMPIYRLFYEVYKDIINESAHCTFENTGLFFCQCLPRQFPKFLQDCCNYLNLLKRNIDCDQKYSIILFNFAVHVTNYLVYLHGIYVIKNTPGSMNALSLEEYYGEATFDTEEDRKIIFRQYFILINSFFDTFLRCTDNIKSL